ncbi:MAG: right-handed parallel beta-helix repeat-containing protein [Clostridiales bacterium]|nr:right-handed parallel beta-helix repeat-containing protein [Clostridiales bacterium]
MKRMKRGLAAILVLCLLLSNVPLTAFAADLTQPEVSACGSTIALTWESMEDAEQYLLERKETSSGTYEQIAVTSDTEYTDSGLNLGTVYYYRLRVMCSDGSYSAYTAGKYAKTDYLEQTVGLSGIYSGSAVTLSWDAVEGAAKYIVYSVGSDGTYTKLGVIASMNYSDSTVESDAVYQYSVRAYYIDTDGTTYRYGAYSDVISVETTTTLGTPVQPNVSVCGSTITLTWDSVEGAEYYLLERKETSSGIYEQIVKTDGTSYVDTGLALGTVYYYRLHVSAGETYSTYTAGKYAKADYLEQVKDLAAAASGTGIVLTWSAVTSAKGYVVYLVDEEGTYTKLGQSSATSYTDSTVTTGESYNYAVRAYYIDGTTYRYGAYSDGVAASADLLSAPEEISVAANGRQITLSWAEVTGASGYVVERREGTDGTYEEIATTSDTLFEEELEQLDAVYYYRVRAYRVLDNDEKDYGTYTSGQYVKTAYLDTPTQLQGILSGATVTFTWDAVDNATGYILYYSTTEDGTYEKVGQTKDLTYTQKKLSLDTTYYYYVCAYYETEEGNYKLSGTSETIVIVTCSSSQVYYDVTELGADGTDTASDDTVIQNALDMATAIDDVVTVYIPAGTYYLDATLKIYSDTILELDAEAVIVRNDESLFMLTSRDETGEEKGGYEQISNITIRGGTWDGNASGDVMRSLFYLYHGDGVVIEDTALKNCCGTHHVELVGVKNATVTGVTFKDFVYCSTVDYSLLLNDGAIATADDDSADTTDDDGADATDDSGEEEDAETYDGNTAEALQLDYCSEETSSGASPFDYTPCVNITVTDCTFENVLNGVGNHHGDAVSENIVIQNNTFIDIKNSCINQVATNGYTITGNHAEDVRGFLLAVSSSGTVSENYVDAGNSTEKAAKNLIEISCVSASSVVVPDSYIELYQNELYNAGVSAVRIKDGTSATITDNTISVCGTVGLYADSESTVTASGNMISDAGTSGMYFQDTSVTLSGNTIQNAATVGILLSNSTGQLEENEIYDSNGNGITVTTGSSLTTSNNVIQNSVKTGISVKDSQIEMSNDSLLYNGENGINVNAATVTAVGVYFDANEGAGAAVFSEGLLSAADSSFSGNATKGIWEYSYGTVVASGCAITDNGEDGVSVQSSSSATISSCVICRNALNGIKVNGAYANLTNNRVTLNGSEDSSSYDIIFRTDSTGSASGNVTDSKGVYCYPSLEIELSGNMITLENDYEISGLEDVYYVTGSAVEPAIIVGTLEEGTDFEVSYSNNIEAGTASVTVTGIGDYTDSLAAEFELREADLSAPELTYSVSGNEITLTASTEEGCSGYRFMRKAEGDSEFVLLADTDAPSYVDSVNYGVTYQYRVQIYAYDGDAEKVSDYSAIAEVEVTLDTPSIASATVAGSLVTIEWACAEGDVYYEIQRKETASGTYETIATVSGQGTYTDSGLSLATVYYYRLRAVGTNADETQYVTSYCAGKYVKTNHLEQTTNLTGEYTDGAVRLSWDAVDGAQKYVIQSVGEDGTYTKLGVTASTSYADSTVSSGGTYRYTVRAYYVVGKTYYYGAYADVISVET